MKSWTNLEADKVKILTKHFTRGRGGYTINKLVLHHNAGRLTTEQCYQVWQTREASAHYQVEVDGTIGQLVWDRDTAWHAANLTVNRQSIGIEHANSRGTTGPLTAATLDNGAHLVAALCVRYKLGRPVWQKNVFGHSDFYATSCPGHIAGDQNTAYMRRAQAYYDAMTNGSVTSSVSKPATVKGVKPKLSVRAARLSTTLGVPTSHAEIIRKALGLPSRKGKPFNGSERAALKARTGYYLPGKVGLTKLLGNSYTITD